MYIKLDQSQWLDLLAELRNLLHFFSHLSFRVLKFANNVLISAILFINYWENCENRYCSAFPQAM